MLNPAIITEYLAKPRNSYEWLKDCSSNELAQALKEYLPKADFAPLNLWRHQQAALVLLSELRRFMLYMDMGAGKTLTSLALVAGLKQQGQQAKAIVFVPYVTSVMTWVDECEKHTPGLRCIPLVSDTASNRQALSGAEPGDLYVICYQSAVAMLSNREGAKWRLDVSEIRLLFSDFNILIMDEVHKCKDVTSLTYKMCLAISRQSEYALGLTGTPFGRDLQALWPQFNLIDFGKTLGPTLGFYREVFFTQKKRYWGGYEYNFRKKLLPDLKRIIRQNSIHYDIDELISLPPKEYVIRTIRCPDAAKGYADEALRALQKSGQERTNPIIEGNYLKLRQLSSGFMTVMGEEKLQIEFEDNPKLEVLIELVEALPPGCKMVIFHHFVYTNALISKRLTELKVPHARVWGGNSKNLAELERFKNDDNCSILVINTRSGSSSLNLQFANYCVFFEQPDSPIDRQQAERRVWRPGQSRRVWYYDLLVEGTVDKRLHESNLAGKHLLQELLKGGSL